MHMLSRQSPGFPPVQHKHCTISRAQEIAHPHIHKYTLSPDFTVTARALAILATVYGREGEGKRILRHHKLTLATILMICDRTGQTLLTRFSPIYMSSSSSKAQYTMSMTQRLVSIAFVNTKHNARINSRFYPEACIPPCCVLVSGHEKAL